MANIASLVVEIKGKVDNLTSALSQGKNQVESFEKSSILSFKNIAIALAAAFSARAIINSINETAEAIDHLNDVSKQINVPVSDIQEFAFAAKRSGSDIDQVTKSMRILSKTVGSASLGNNELSQTFRRLGLNLSTLKVLNPAEQFEMVSSALQGVINDSERMNLSLKLFGRDGATAVNQISTELEDARKQFRGLGVALTDSQVDAVASFNDSRDALDAIFQGIKQQTVAALAPSFKAFIDNILDIIKSYGGIKSIAETVSNFIVSTIKTIVGFFRQWKDSGEGLFDNIISKFPDFEKFVNTVKELGGNLKDVYSSAVSLTTDVFEKLAPIAEKVKAAFIEIKPIIVDIINSVVSGFQSFSKELDNIIHKLANIVGIGQQLKQLKDTLGFGDSAESKLSTNIVSSVAKGSNLAQDSGTTNIGNLLDQRAAERNQTVNVQISGDINDFLTAAVTSPTFAEAITSVTDRIMQNTARAVSR